MNHNITAYQTKSHARDISGGAALVSPRLGKRQATRAAFAARRTLVRTDLTRG